MATENANVACDGGATDGDIVQRGSSDTKPSNSTPVALPSAAHVSNKAVSESPNDAGGGDEPTASAPEASVGPTPPLPSPSVLGKAAATAKLNATAEGASVVKQAANDKEATANAGPESGPTPSTGLPAPTASPPAPLEIVKSALPAHQLAAPKADAAAAESAVKQGISAWRPKVSQGRPQTGTDTVSTGSGPLGARQPAPDVPFALREAFATREVGCGYSDATDEFGNTAAHWAALGGGV